MSARIQRAILSVTDKTGLVDFARKLSALGVELVSTGGTAKLLRDSGITVQDISELTGFPEMLDGRVKTLHPKVHGGILHRREDPKHVAAVAEHGIAPIDMVVVNLYAFEKTAAKPGVAFEELIENIDIGGPSMIRSAAKNFHDVAIVTSPADYDSIADELAARRRRVSPTPPSGASPKKPSPPPQPTIPPSRPRSSASAQTRLNLSPKPIRSRPPCASRSTKPSTCATAKIRTRRPPCIPTAPASGVANARQLQGKELSYNNIVDLQAAWDLAQEFNDPAASTLPFVAIIKHTNPCGAATGKTLAEAYKRALECDPVSAFGGVIGVNRPIDAEAAEEMHKLFLEVIAAPAFDEAAHTKFATKKNLRLVESPTRQQTMEPRTPRPGSGRGVRRSRSWVLKKCFRRMLVQDADLRPLQDADLKVVTQRPPTPEETRALLFAWKVCKHVKSNAIVYARDGQTVGVGAGQMTRVDAAKIGAMKAQLPLKGTVAASDAFFPFPDGVEEIARAGATAIIQPGGSQRDPEVIAAANRLGLAMLFTGVRHFRH